MDLLGLSRNCQISHFPGLVPQGHGNQRRSRSAFSFSTVASFVESCGTHVYPRPSLHKRVRVGCRSPGHRRVTRKSTVNALDRTNSVLKKMGSGTAKRPRPWQWLSMSARPCSGARFPRRCRQAFSLAPAPWIAAQQCFRATFLPHRCDRKSFR